MMTFRLGVSQLRTHKLGYRKGVTPVDYLDLFCAGDVETEGHFILVCLKYAEIREQYILESTSIALPVSNELSCWLPRISFFRQVLPRTS